MRVAFLFFVAILAVGWISSCGVGSFGVNPNVVVTITNKPGGIPQGTSLVFNATVTGDPANKGVTWSLTPGNDKGTLTNISLSSVTYNAPTTPPFPINQVILTAGSVSDAFSKADSAVFSVTVPGLTTTITNKISTINAGGGPVTLNAQVTNDPRNAGVNWFITTPTANCAAACGTLSNQMPFSVVYTPPLTFPSSPFNMPYIQANSVTDPTEFDRNSFTIH